MSENNILGVVLAGGKSQRFGQDKVEANLGNKTLIEHTLDKIKFKFEDVIIVSQKTNFKDVAAALRCITFVLLRRALINSGKASVPTSANASA